MRKIIALAVALAFVVPAFAERFLIQVPEDDYNQIQVHNLSSVESFTGKLYKLEKDGDDFRQKMMLGAFSIKYIDDTCTLNKKIKENEWFALDLPESLDGKFSYELEHKDFPFFDILVVHIMDRD